MTHALSAKLTLLLLVIAVTRLFAQEPLPCPPPAAPIAPGDPAYEDALSLKKNLESQGMEVRCIFETKFSSQFLDRTSPILRSKIEGEACLRTNLGDLGVLFMWRPRTFAELNIKERHQGGWYVYTFSGMADVWPSNIKRSASKDRTYYFLHGNYLLSAVGDKMRSALESALHQSPLSL